MARKRELSRAFAIIVLAAFGLAGPAAAKDRIVTVTGFNAPGPAKYDRVRVLQQGPTTAKHVLVLMPGTSASAAYFKPVADDLVKRLPGWQVWSVDRRENALEDLSVADRARAGTATPQQLFDYYLNWIGNAAITTHFQPVADKDVPFARQWGMRVAIEDLHRVIAQARKGGRTVVLGGHSLGGTITTAYATWDFNGRAGAKDLAGLVFIDGAGGGRAPVTTAAAKRQLADLAKTSPFLDLTGLHLPWSAGVFNVVGSTLALKDPDTLSPLAAWPLLPANLKPPVPATNAGGYGYALDTETGPKSLALVQMHLGHLATSGDPRGWVDGELVPVKRAATVFSGIPTMDGTSWYHPRRLSIDGSAVNNGVANPAQKTLDVRATHGRDADLPIYAFAASLGNTRVLDAAKQLARQSGVPASSLTLVNRAKTFAHVDPIAASPDRNDFLKTVVPFLKRIG